MMVLRLEVFESEKTSLTPDTVVLDTSALEEARLQAYETGYSAGWEDATASQSNDQTKLRADLARNLQSLSFTYQEARSHILRALEPLMEDMVGKLLPALAQEALAAMVLEQVMPIAERLGDASITLVLNPSARAAVEPLVAAATGLPLHVEEEESLGEGQVYLRFGPQETLIDLDRTIREITTAVRGFFDLSRKETSHG